MKGLYRFLLGTLNSWFSVLFIVAYCVISFYFGQRCNDMNLFAASGGVMTVFGLLSMIRFTTIEKYLNQEGIAADSTGITGPPLRAEAAEKLKKQNQERAKARLKRELRSELRGIMLTIIGTLVWAYGSYMPVFH